MTLFWVIAAVLTFAAVSMVLIPLSASRATAGAVSGPADEAVYREQLAALESEVERGALDASTAAEARAEIGRRLLHAHDRQRAGTAEGLPKLVLFASVLAIPLFAWGAYAMLGQPGLPAQPLQARLNKDVRQSSIEELVARAERALMENPADMRGWAALGPIYMRLGRFDDAVNAYRAVLRIGGETAAMRAALAEAEIASAGGVVTADAKNSLDRAVALDPSEPRARYFLALAKRQEGDAAGAIGLWNRLAESEPPDSPWFAAARQAAQLAASEPAGEAAPGPDAAAVEAASRMSSGDRQAMIRNMVAGLDARLKEEGGSVDEWLRLINAYGVLGEQDKLHEAVRRALAAFEGDEAALEKIRAAGGRNRRSRRRAGPGQVGDKVVTRKQKRIGLIAGAAAFLGLALALVLIALNQQIVFFVDPSAIAAKPLEPGQHVRLGGLVATGSVERGGSETIRFAVTDGAASVPVRYQGILPDLFREGQGVIAEGEMDADGVFVASTVLAKHDERYMPREVADSLKEKGLWQEEGAGEAAPSSAAPARRRLPPPRSRRSRGIERMLIETGHFALVLALALCLFQGSVPLAGALRADGRAMAMATPTALAAFALVALSFGILGAAYYRSDFSVVNVFENSHSQQPALYRLTGTWGNHEGSMMLWVFILTLFTALVAAFGNGLPARLKALVLVVQGWIGSAFLLFILLTSNPFARLDPAPMEGRDLNPILQDIGLAIHPPLLYLGYVGFSVAFSFAIAALIDGRMEAAWARWVRPWTLLAWTFLTAGIAMGSYWAYYELGWGGWWFWDPVENASFMPWLAGTALLHSAIVMEKRDALKIWTLLLAILTFSLSLLGTFLVRSGVLTSVHSFASDPDPWPLHSRYPDRLHRRRAAALRSACRQPEGGRSVRADQPRRGTGAQQSLPRLGDRDRSRRHPLSLGR